MLKGGGVGGQKVTNLLKGSMKRFNQRGGCKITQLDPKFSHFVDPPVK